MSNLDVLDVDAFQKVASEASELIVKHVKEKSNILVVGHNDADALASLGIISRALYELDAHFTVRSVARIDELFSSFDDGEYDLLILVDLGSGYIPDLKERVKKTQLIILDHHKPFDLDSPRLWIHVNPHLFGIDGASEISAAGVCYFVSKYMLEDPARYAPLAVVGALGDLQDKNYGRKLGGLNASIVEEAVKAGVMLASEDFILYGRRSRPIHQALASTHSPFVPGLSGNEAACLDLVISAGIEVRSGELWRTLLDLSDDEKKRLYNAIIAHLVKNKYPPSIASELIGTVYEITSEDEWTSLRDAREYATLLNACGKTGNAWVGIAVAMGLRGHVLEEAQRIHENYKQIIARAMEYATRPGVIEQMHNITILRGGTEINPRQISSIASILSSSQLLPSDKPLLALALEGSLVKISARASSKLAEMGLDLGAILSESAKAFYGRGGGHKMAAGAEVTADRLTLFLMEVDRLVGEALRGKQQPIQTSLDEG